MLTITYQPQKGFIFILLFESFMMIGLLVWTRSRHANHVSGSHISRVTFPKHIYVQNVNNNHIFGSGIISKAKLRTESVYVI